jgi:acyl carrier protein
MLDSTIRAVLKEHGQLAVDVAGLEDEADLYQAGLTSYATVKVMIALEDAFDVMFPEQMLRKRTFESLAAIRAALEELADQVEGQQAHGR